MPTLLSQPTSQHRLRHLDEWRAFSRQALDEVARALAASGYVSFDDCVGLYENPALLGLGPLDEMLAEMAPTEDIQVLLTAYLGEYLIAKFDGNWIVDTDPVSDSYARYIIDARASRTGPRVQLDVNAYAADFMRRAQPRSLLRLVMDLETSLADC